ncbi:hypothetical protein [Oceanicella sp. SM1341]|uniref:hypothetical protein n=1 Tax=Oceanicella sp. SM1341 TaxID=1548889 RepID=UPI000E4E9BEA|nr:hypothetical protein [Oceanicella sp. SM1341]
MDLESVWTGVLAALRAVRSFVDHWQTLIAGLLALVAGGLTVRMMRRQLQQIENHRTERRSQTERTARAGLPLLLSEVSRWADAVATAILRACPDPIFRGRAGAEDLSVSPDYIRTIEVDSGSLQTALEIVLPETVRTGLPDAVEKLPEAHARQMRLLLQRVALVYSELGAFGGKNAIRLRPPFDIRTVSHRLLDLATVLLLVNRALPYATQESEEVVSDATCEDLEAFLSRVGCSDSFIAFMREYGDLAAWAARCSPPTNP